MLDLKLLRDNPDLVRKALAPPCRSGAGGRGAGRRCPPPRLVKEAETLKNQLNTVSKEIGQTPQGGRGYGRPTGRHAGTGRAIAPWTNRSGWRTRSSARACCGFQHAARAACRTGKIPPTTWWFGVGQAPGIRIRPQGHVELGENLGLFDFTRATKMTGAGFPL